MLCNKIHIYLAILSFSGKPHAQKESTRNVNCGTPNGNPQISPHIVGGNQSAADAWPWQVRY
jgi:hypothetical protein